MNNLFSLIRYSVIYRIITSKISSLIFYTLFALAMMFFSYNLYFVLVDGFKTVGLPREMILLTAGAITLIMVFFQNVYGSSEFLFDNGDFQLLTCLPIKDRDIILSRMFMLYIYNLAFYIVIMYPSFLVYGKLNNCNFLYYIYSVVFIVVFPVVTLIIGSLIAILLAYIATRFNKSIAVLQTMLVMLFIAVIIAFVFFKGQVSVEEAEYLYFTFTENLIISGFIKTFKEVYFVNLFLFTIICLIILFLFAEIFSKNFKQINAIFIESHKINRFKYKKFKVHSPVTAIVLKETKNLFSSFVYFINSYVGIFVLLILSIGYLILGDKVFGITKNPVITGMNFKNVVIGNFILLIMMSQVNASVISLEGKNLWILKSLPISSEKILFSKVLYSVYVKFLPVFISCIIVFFALNLDFLYSITLFIISILTLSFCAQFTLFVNLLFPKFIFKNRVEVVKQSRSVFWALLIGIIFGLIMLFIAMNFKIYITIIILTILNIIFYFLIKIKGVRIYNSYE